MHRKDAPTTYRPSSSPAPASVPVAVAVAATSPSTGCTSTPRAVAAQGGPIEEAASGRTSAGQATTCRTSKIGGTATSDSLGPSCAPVAASVGITPFRRPIAVTGRTTPPSRPSCPGPSGAGGPTPAAVGATTVITPWGKTTGTGTRTARRAACGAARAVASASAGPSYACGTPAADTALATVVAATALRTVALASTTLPLPARVARGACWEAALL